MERVIDNVMGVGQEDIGPLVQPLNVERIFDFLQGKLERF